MANKTKAKRIERLEGICIGVGFLLKKLRAEYGNDFGEGMSQQVNACINDCDQIGLAVLLRNAQAEAAERTAA